MLKRLLLTFLAAGAIFGSDSADLVNFYRCIQRRGVGVIGIMGVAGAIANSVYHATGNRVRTLPITPNRVLGL